MRSLLRFSATRVAPVGLLLTLLWAVGALSGNGFGLGFVTSNSMEPSLRVGDGFMLVPYRRGEVGDVIVYRPTRLPAEQIVHRIVGIEPGGFITRGDNSPSADQEAGEPPVTERQMIGMALTSGGVPVRIPGVGPLSSSIRNLLGRYAFTFSLGVAVASVGVSTWDMLYPKRTRPTRRRWRVGTLYWTAAVAFTLGIVIAMASGAQTRAIRYLAMAEPDGLPNHIPVGEAGTVRATAANTSLLPVVQVIEPLPPAVSPSEPAWVGPLSQTEFRLNLPVHDQPGWSTAYVRVYHYPPVLPKGILVWLHRQSHLWALFGAVAAPLVLVSLLSFALPLRIPLKAVVAAVPRAWRSRRWYRLRRAAR